MSALPSTSEVGSRATPADAVAAVDESAREARLAHLLRSWWQEERPPWTERSWWEATLREDVRRVLWLPAGPLLVIALSEMPRGDPACPEPHVEDRMSADWPTPGHAAGWPCACQVVTAAAWEACAAWLAARAAEALVAAAGSVPVSFDVGDRGLKVQDPAREELAHALRSSIPAMGNRIGYARALTTHPRLVALVETAAVSAWAGRLVLEHLTDLEDLDADRVICDVANRVTERLLSGRRPYHSAEVNRLARAARLRICPESAQEARVRTFRTRRVVVHPGADGMATLIAELAETDAHRIHRRLTAIAAGLESDAAADGTPEVRTRDQLRADILTDLLVGGGAPTTCDGAAPGPAGDPKRPVGTRGSPLGSPGPGCPQTLSYAGRNTAGRPEVEVIVTIETLLGLTNDPAEIPGVGPIPAETARALAADGRWRAWITDAAGAVASTGTQSYVPSADLARLVRARDPRCRFPGCRQPATRCDLDHAIPWPRGESTPANLGPLCRRHHNLKTHGAWSLQVASAPASPNPGFGTPPGTAGTTGSPAAGDPTSGWRWRTPAGFTLDDGPEPPLGSPVRGAGSVSGTEGRSAPRA